MNLKQMIDGLKERGIAQSEIAAVTGYSPQYISDLATGKRGIRPAHDLTVSLTAFYKRKGRK